MFSLQGSLCLVDLGSGSESESGSGSELGLGLGLGVAVQLRPCLLFSLSINQALTLTRTLLCCAISTDYRADRFVMKSFLLRRQNIRMEVVLLSLPRQDRARQD